MQVLVMYCSRTGNTKKLAEEIAKGVGEVDGVTCTGAPDGRTARDAAKLGRRVALLVKRLSG